MSNLLALVMAFFSLWVIDWSANATEDALRKHKEACQ